MEYHALMQAGELKPDTDQANAVNELERLYHALASYSQSGIQKSNWLTRFFSNSAKKKPSPKGIYLYGDVGRGKSMLMDLFYSVAPLTMKRRIHFHEVQLPWAQFHHRKCLRIFQ